MKIFKDKVGVRYGNFVTTQTHMKCGWFATASEKVRHVCPNCGDECVDIEVGRFEFTDTSSFFGGSHTQVTGFKLKTGVTMKKMGL